MITDRDEIHDFLSRYYVTDYDFDVNGRVGITQNATGDLRRFLRESDAKKYDYQLPISFYKSSDFELANVKTLIGSPEKVYGTFDVLYCLYLKDFEGVPKDISRDFNVSLLNNIIEELKDFPETIGGSCNLSVGIKSFHNIHKYCKSVNNSFYINSSKLESSILGLLLVKNVTDYLYGDRSNKDASQSIVILRNHYKADGSGDILECQEELIENGFKQFAKL